MSLFTEINSRCFIGREAIKVEKCHVYQLIPNCFFSKQKIFRKKSRFAGEKVTFSRKANVIHLQAGEIFVLRKKDISLIFVQLGPQNFGKS